MDFTMCVGKSLKRSSVAALTVLLLLGFASASSDAGAKTKGSSAFRRAMEQREKRKQAASYAPDVNLLSATSKVNGEAIHNVTILNGFGGVNFIMAVHEEVPFINFDESKTGNARFSGITIDLANKICEMLECTLEFEICDEENPENIDACLKAVGAGQAVGTPHTADIAGGAIHITASRASLVHFSTPFYDTGYSLVIARPDEEISMWTFLTPFAPSLWYGILVEFAIVTLLWYFMESPWLSAHDDSDVVDGKVLGLIDCLYWCLTVPFGVPDKAPHTWGGKVVMLAHGFFLLVLINAYTANLAASLTGQALAQTISQWSDITDTGTKYKLSLPVNTSHAEFIEQQASDFGFTFDIDEYTSWEDGLLAVLDGKSEASFHDTAIVNYFLANTLAEEFADDPEKQCGLMTVGDEFQPVGYGFAFGLDSTAFIPFSQAIVALKESGEIDKIIDGAGVGTEADNLLTERCGGDDGSSQFRLSEFWGMIILCSVLFLGAIAFYVFEKIGQAKSTGSQEEPTEEAVTEETKVELIGETKKDGLEDRIMAAVKKAISESLASQSRGGLAASTRAPSADTSSPMMSTTTPGRDREIPARDRELPVVKADLVTGSNGFGAGHAHEASFKSKASTPASDAPRSARMNASIFGVEKDHPIGAIEHHSSQFLKRAGTLFGIPDPDEELEKEDFDAVTMSQSQPVVQMAFNGDHNQSLGDQEIEPSRGTPRQAGTA